MAMDSRAGAISEYHDSAIVGCTRCALHQTRTNVVPGSGNPSAEVMFIGEAPGYHEDRSGLPFVGQAGQLLDRLLAGLGWTRDDVFIANVLKCRPPGNRDPLTSEIEACEGHLFRQVQLIQPRMICTLGNFSTKLISGRSDSISRVHGCELPITVGGHETLLYPLFHPAAALYTPSMLTTLEEDFARIPDLIGVAEPITPLAEVPETPVARDPLPSETPSEASSGASPAEHEQLGLF